VNPEQGLSLATQPRKGSLLRDAWGTAVKEAAKILVWALLLGELLSFGLFVAADGRGDPLDYVKGGGVYFATFHRVAIVADLSGLGGEALRMAGAPSGLNLKYELSFGLLLGTVFVLWLAYRAGRKVAERVGGGSLAAVVHAAKVSLPYAVASFLLMLPVRFDVGADLGPAVTGEATFSVSRFGSFVLPLLVAGIPAAFGGLLTKRGEVQQHPLGRRALASAAGGLWMLVLGAAFSLFGLVVAGWVQPGEPVAYLAPTTPGYLREVFAEGPVEGFQAIVNHVFVLPNESVLVLVPAMGGCDKVDVAGFISFKILCYGNFPYEDALESLASQTAVGPPGNPFEGNTAPAGYFLFLLAPALAALLGGRLAARRGEAGSPAEAVALGAGGGVVFALLTGVAAAMSGLSVGVAAEIGFALDLSASFGTPAATAGVLALAWGVIGGGIGGVLAGARAAPVSQVPPVPGPPAPSGPPPQLPPPPGA